MIKGLSQWLIGRNVTRKCNIVHVGQNVLELPNQDTIALSDHDMHSYIPYQVFDSDTDPGIPAQEATMFCAIVQLDSHPVVTIRM